MTNRNASITRTESKLGSRKLVVRNPACSKGWRCFADKKFFSRRDFRKAQYGYGTSPEPEDFVPDKPTTGLD